MQILNLSSPEPIYPFPFAPMFPLYMWVTSNLKLLHKLFQLFHCNCHKSFLGPTKCWGSNFAEIRTSIRTAMNGLLMIHSIKLDDRSSLALIKKSRPEKNSRPLTISSSDVVMLHSHPVIFWQCNHIVLYTDSFQRSDSFCKNVEVTSALQMPILV